MATIKEVAAYAGVSIGTVSNALNGKTNNIELIERVEQAMKELEYRPDANARSLKNTKSNMVAFILPNIMHPDLQTLLYTVEMELREKRYSLLLKISQNNPVIERKCIEQCLEQRVEAIIIYSYSKEENFSSLIKEKIPVIFINKQSKPNFISDSIMIDYEKALEKAISNFYENDFSELGLIIERNLIEENRITEIYKKYYNNIDNIKIVDYSKERGFKAAYELLYHNRNMKALITSNYLISVGAKKAISLLNCENVSLVTFKEQNWIEDENNYIATIGVSYKKIGECAVKKLINSIENPNTYEIITEYFQAEYVESIPLLANIEQGFGNNKKLKLAMFDCPAAQSLCMLSEIYNQQTGNKIEFEMLKYNDLEEKLYALTDERYSDIDAFMMDITWIEGLVKSNIVQPLDELLKDTKEYFNGFLDGMISEYGMQSKRLYGIPFMPGTQLLFYQKDLFEDQGLKRLFKRLYKEELVPPTTWAEFNLIAEFFTRRFNDKSPVKYGSVAVQGENVFTSICFLNRLWSYGSDVFTKEGKVSINNNNSLAALKNFIKSYQFASKDRVNVTWDDMVEEFKSGDGAMVVLYDSHAVEINDYTKSKIAGNIGYSLIPGKTPVLGGWSLGVNINSKNKKEVVKFLLWACSNHSSIPNSLLGGTTFRENYYTSKDLENLYPWKSLLIDSYKISKKRIVPKLFYDNKKENDIYSYIISEEINKVITGVCSEEKALENIEKRLIKLVETK